MKGISILGATGSIGTQTLEVLQNQSEDFKLVGISAHKNYQKILNIIRDFNPKIIAITDEETYFKVRNFCKESSSKAQILYGLEGLNAVATLDEADVVITSVVGMVGLVPTINAIRAGKDIALANKETLVVGGEIVINEAKKQKVRILPVDSEHCAIFQCLQGNVLSSVSKIILTASGGPFRGKTYDELLNVTSYEALKHPKWNMGKKISIDSATLMNKGLEVIEAHWLFDVAYDNIEVVVHPQSIVHSMVEYIDGSVMAQLGVTDMRLPIQYALNYPNRRNNVVDKLNFFSIGNLAFEKPDYDTFKCLKLAFEAGKVGGTVPTTLNAANEVAVELFLRDKIKFLQIADIIEECLNRFQHTAIRSIEDILEADKRVRDYLNKKYNFIY